MNIQDQELYSIEKGDSKNPSVILIHGLLGSSRNMLRVAEFLANNEFYVIAYDQRGHGHSSHSNDPENAYTLLSLGNDVFKITERYQLKKPHIIGHSLGGRVSLVAVNQNQKMFSSLTMLDVGIKIHPESLQRLIQIINPLPTSFASIQEAKAFLTSHLDFLKSAKPQMEQFLLSNLRTNGSKVHWIFDLKGIQSVLISSVDYDQTEAWKNLEIPTHLLRGESSDHFKSDEFEMMRKLKPEMMYTKISNAGHWLHVDNFKDTCESILAFLKQVHV